MSILPKLSIKSEGEQDIVENSYFYLRFTMKMIKGYDWVDA